jgi:hypothetical protein
MKARFKMDKYNVANIFLGEASVDPRIRGLTAQRENIKKQIKAMNLKLAELAKQIAEAGGSLIQEDNAFELEMLLSEKDQAIKVYKAKNFEGKLKFSHFDMDGVEHGDATIEFTRKPRHMSFEEGDILNITLYFTPHGVEGVEEGVVRYFAPYSYFYNQPDTDVKWEAMFEVRYWPALKHPYKKK